MSVTFWMPQAPTTRVQPYPDDEPDYFEEVPEPPFTEINMANANAADLLQLVCPGADPYCGQWGMETIDAVRRRIFTLLNLHPERYAVAGYVDRNFCVIGRDMDYVTRRLHEMLVLLTVARQHGFEVAYG